jgi:hypothetical protein
VNNARRESRGNRAAAALDERPRPVATAAKAILGAEGREGIDGGREEGDNGVEIPRAGVVIEQRDGGWREG